MEEYKETSFPIGHMILAVMAPYVKPLTHSFRISDSL